jgi:hypothetical protein
MPAERVSQIAVNVSQPVDEGDAGKGTCISYAFQFKHPEDWMGVFTLIGGDSWGTKPGYDIRKMLGLKPTATAVLRFRARGAQGGEVATLQIGAVTNGRYKSSIPFARTLNPDPVRLSKGWKEYQIPIRASELTNVVDPMCVVAKASDNSGKESIEIFVDDVRFEPAK